MTNTTAPIPVELLSLDRNRNLLDLMNTRFIDGVLPSQYRPSVASVCALRNAWDDLQATNHPVTALKFSNPGYVNAQDQSERAYIAQAMTGTDCRPDFDKKHWTRCVQRHCLRNPDDGWSVINPFDFNLSAVPALSNGISETCMDFVIVSDVSCLLIDMTRGPSAGATAELLCFDSVRNHRRYAVAVVSEEQATMYLKGISKFIHRYVDLVVTDKFIKRLFKRHGGLGFSYLRNVQENNYRNAPLYKTGDGCWVSARSSIVRPSNT